MAAAACLQEAWPELGGAAAGLAAMSPQPLLCLLLVALPVALLVAELAGLAGPALLVAELAGLAELAEPMALALGAPSQLLW